MKGYEIYLRRCQHAEYIDRYVDYGAHKDLLRRFYGRRRQLSQILRDEGGRLTVDDFSRITGESSLGSSLTSSGYFRYDSEDGAALVDGEDALLRLSITERKEFGGLLERGISEAALYYTRTLLPEAQRLVADAEYEEAATKLLEAIAFACTNVITFRQLLIRYDAFCQTFYGCALDEWHLQRSVLDVDHPVHGMFQLDGVDELEKRIVVGLQERSEKEVDAGTEEGSKKGAVSAEEFSAQLQSFEYLLEKTGSSLEKAVAGHVVFKDRLLALVTRMKQYLMFGFQSRELLI